MVDDRGALDVRLAAWLSAEEGRPVAVRSLSLASAGARRTNALFEAVVGDEVRWLALTLNPHAAVQALDVAGESAVRTLAERAGVPSPHIHYVCEDESVLGGPFFISTAVAGETVPRRLLRLVEAAGNGEHVVAQLGAAMALLHSVDPALAPQGVVLAGTAPVDAALQVIADGLAQLLDPSPTFSYCLRWLERNRPSGPGATNIIHGDIRTGNIVVDENGLAAILDWEGSRIGDPMEDAAWPCMRMWRFRQDDHTVGGMAGVDTLRDAYVGAGGVWDEERFAWWRVLGTVRWGLGLARQAREHLDGSYPSIVMAASGRRVPELEYDALLLLRPG